MNMPTAPRLYIQPPDCCPECNTNLVMDGEYLVCRGEDCPAQVAGAITRWVSKIGVLGIGPSIIAALVDQAGVLDAADLYVLDPAKIESVDVGGSRLGRTATTMLDELRSKSEVPLHTFVGSLGIPMCARSVCKLLVDAGYDSLDKMAAATVAHLSTVPGLGPSKATSFVEGFASRRPLMDKLLANGVTIKAKSVGALTGKSVCFTGVRIPALEKAIEDAGGTIKGSVGKGLTYLVQKDKDSQSGKSQKAKDLGVEVVGVDDMWALVGHVQGAPAGTTSITTAPRKQAAVRRASPAPADDSGGIFDLFGGGDE